MKKILFVCTGNTCRSPMAEGLCNKYLREQGLTEELCCASAGLAVIPDDRVSRYARQAMEEVGVDISQHTPTQLTPEMLEACDFVMCMSDNHRMIINAAVPGKPVAVPEGGVPDPFGTSLASYQACRDALWAVMPEIVRLAQTEEDESK